MVADAFERSVVLGEKPARDRRIALGVAHAWVRNHAGGSLAEIEAATLRLVTLRTSRNVSHAAERLGMRRMSLFKWPARRVRMTDLEAPLGDLFRRNKRVLERSDEDVIAAMTRPR